MSLEAGTLTHSCQSYHCVNVEIPAEVGISHLRRDVAEVAERLQLLKSLSVTSPAQPCHCALNCRGALLPIPELINHHVDSIPLLEGRVRSAEDIMKRAVERASAKGSATVIKSSLKTPLKGQPMEQEVRRVHFKFPDAGPTSEKSAGGGSDTVLKPAIGHVNSDAEQESTLIP